MEGKLQYKYITLLTACLAYFSNSFVVNLPFVISESPFLDFGISVDQCVSANATLLVFQNLGILAGALVFSFWADKKGRLFIMLISVFIYSFCTFLGGIVNNYYSFLALRFAVGFGLAPEIGMGIVLVSEIFPRRKSSLFVAIIAVFGFSAVLLLSYVSKHFNWRDIYISAGLGGLLIMMARFASFESDLFLKIKEENEHIINIFKTLKSPKFGLLLLCMLPVYVITAGSTFVVSEIFSTYQMFVQKNTLTICFALGAILGFVLIPIVTNKLKSRKRVFLVCFSSLLVISAFTSFNAFLGEKGLYNFLYFYTIVFSYGFFSGYLFEFFIFAMEHFGTNRRGSATTLLFSLGRSSVFLFSIFIPNFKNLIFHNFLNTLLFIESIVFILAIWAIVHLKEEFNKDLDFID